MCIITFKSLTSAQQAGHVLSSLGIFSSIVSVDPSLTKRGCSYGVSVSCSRINDVKYILEKNSVKFGDVIVR